MMARFAQSTIAACLTCFSSMSYWKNMVSCFNGIFRILKPGGSAKLVEPQADIDLDQVVETIKLNLAQEKWFRRFFASNLNKYTLKYGRSLGLKLYSSQDIARIISESKFKKTHKVERVAIQDLPFFFAGHVDQTILNSPSSGGWLTQGFLLVRSRKDIFKAERRPA